MLTPSKLAEGKARETVSILPGGELPVQKIGFAVAIFLVGPLLNVRYIEEARFHTNCGRSKSQLFIRQNTHTLLVFFTLFSPRSTRKKTPHPPVKSRVVISRNLRVR
jgi:hypothetical protein